MDMDSGRELKFFVCHLAQPAADTIMKRRPPLTETKAQWRNNGAKLPLERPPAIPSREPLTARLAAIVWSSRGQHRLDAGPPRAT